MGATLPVLTEALSRSNPNFGANLGRLYGWNTLGAMLGAIGTEAVLVRWFGITSSGFVALSLNLDGGRRSRCVCRCARAARRSTGRPPSPRPALSARTYRYLLVGFLSGAVMLALEVVWFRFLLLTYTGTALTFAADVDGGAGRHRSRRARRRPSRARRRPLLPLAAARDSAQRCASWCSPITDSICSPLARSGKSPTVAGVRGIRSVSLCCPSPCCPVPRSRWWRARVKEELGASMRTAGIAALWNTVGAMAGSLVRRVPAAAATRDGAFAVHARGRLLRHGAACAGGGWRRSRGYGHALGKRRDRVRRRLALALFPFGLMQRSFFTIVRTHD